MQREVYQMKRKTPRSIWAISSISFPAESEARRLWIARESAWTKSNSTASFHPISSYFPLLHFFGGVNYNSSRQEGIKINGHAFADAKDCNQRRQRNVNKGEKQGGDKGPIDRFSYSGDVRVVGSGPGGEREREHLVESRKIKSLFHWPAFGRFHSLALKPPQINR